MIYQQRGNDIKRSRIDWMIRLVTGYSTVRPSYPYCDVVADEVENNKHSPPGTIDLHGLYVKEAIERTETAIANAQRSGAEELRVIVGKGIHSQGHVAKIKPAVQGLMQK